MIVIKDFTMPDCCFHCPACTQKESQPLSMGDLFKSYYYECWFTHNYISERGGGYVRRKPDCPLVEISDKLDGDDTIRLDVLINEVYKANKQAIEEQVNKEQIRLARDDKHLQFFATKDGYDTFPKVDDGLMGVFFNRDREE